MARNIESVSRPPRGAGKLVTRSKRWVIAALVFLAVAALSWHWWLPLPAEFLVRGDPPAKADAIVVLAGDGYGNRVRKGADLALQGYAPIVLTSGAAWIYGVCECDLAIDYAVRNGYPRSLFEPLRNDATSTDAEARVIFAGPPPRWKSILIVTSDYHTRRTRILLNRLKPPELRLIVVAAPDRFFRADRWWWHRESRKTLLTEWAKLAAAMLGGL